MPIETLAVEYEGSYDPAFSSGMDDIEFDSSSRFLQPPTDNLVRSEFTLSRKHWFSANAVALFQCKAAFSAESSSSLWIQVITRRLWPMLDRRFFEIEKMSTLSTQIPHQLVQIADESALNILSTDESLVTHAAQLLQSALSELSRLNLSANMSLTSFADPESEEEESLVLEIRISNKSYADILSIWDGVSAKLLSALPIAIQKKITIVFDEA
jgi:hypothetical protein